MIAVMILMFWPNRSGATEAGASRAAPRRVALGHVLMVAAGFWGGFIQIGVGFILMPILHRVLGFDLVRVNGHKVIIVLVYTIVALLVFAATVSLAWAAGIALAAGMAAGGWLGARTTLARGEKAIRLVLAAVLLAFIARLLYASFQ